MISSDFSFFIHALATELDLQAGSEDRDVLLYSIGERMAGRLPLPTCETVEAFEMECNMLLGLIRWGRIFLSLDHNKRLLSLEIIDFARVGSIGNSTGHWFAALYAGLIETWFRQRGEPVKLVFDAQHSTHDRMLFSVGFDV